MLTIAKRCFQFLIIGLFFINLIPSAQATGTFGIGASIQVRTTGQEVVFDYSYINVSNHEQAGNIFGMPRRPMVIKKNDSVLLDNTSGKDVFIFFKKDESGRVVISFSAGIYSFDEKDCGWSGIAGGCDDYDRMRGIGFYGNDYERIYTDSPAVVEAEGLSVSVQPIINSEPQKVTEELNSFVIPKGHVFSINVEGYKSQIPTGSMNLADNVPLTDLKGNDHLKVNLAYDLSNPTNQGQLEPSDHQIVVYYKQNGEEKSEEYQLNGGQEIRIYGNNPQFVRARAAMGFPDRLSIHADGSDYTGFSKLEYLKPGTDEVLGTFTAGKVTRIDINAYSGNFSYFRSVKPADGATVGLSLDTKFQSGDSVNFRQEGEYIRIVTRAPVDEKPANPGISFKAPSATPGPGPQNPIPGFIPADPVDDGGDDEGAEDDSENKDTTIGSGIEVSGNTLGGGGCSLAQAAPYAQGAGSFLLLAVMALPGLIQGIRRK